MRSRNPTFGRLCLCIALGAAAAAAHGGATLYKWVDADGVVHYSDRPTPGAEKVHVAGAQSYQAPAATAAPRGPATAATATDAYTRLEITDPADGTVYSNTGGRIDVSAVVEPGLAAGHQLWFVLDGNRQPQPAEGGYASLVVERGTHTLAATITDASGRELATSPAISFTVHQTSAATPPQGPSLPRPRPKP